MPITAEVWVVEVPEKCEFHITHKESEARKILEKARRDNPHYKVMCWDMMNAGTNIA